MYFSNQPRDFPHQNRGKPIPLEIPGTTKRLDADNNSCGNWEKFMGRTSDFQVCSDPNKQTECRKKMTEELSRGKVNIFPKQEEQHNPVRYEKRVFPNAVSNTNNTGGIINQLTRQDADNYTPQKSILNTQHKQSDVDLTHKNARRPNSMAEALYFSQIKQLPGQAYREGEEIKLKGQVEERNKGLLQLSYRSQITNLPCSSLGMIERQMDKPVNVQLYKGRFQYTTPEICSDLNLDEEQFHKVHPHTYENIKHCEQEFDIHSDNSALKRFPDKKDNLVRNFYPDEQVNPDSITGCRKKKSNNDPFHAHFKLG